MGDLPRLELPRKPQYIKLAEDVDFVALFERVQARFENCFLFESLGDDSQVSRYSILGLDPAMVLSAKESTLNVESGGVSTSYDVPNPYFALRDIIPQNAICREYAGGLVGYLAYESMSYFETSLALQPHPHFDRFRFGLYKDGLILDKLTNELNYFFYTEDRSPLFRELIQALPDSAADNDTQVDFLGDSLTREEHAQVVERVKEFIRAGRIYQAEVGFRSNLRIRGSTLPIYRALREINPSPFMFFVKFGPQILIGASPELMFRLHDREMQAFPLAGSIGRGKDAADDIRLSRRLLGDLKERAEHAMLVDLHRNDIGRVAEFGTVKVKELMGLKKFRYVQHIGSEVVGIARRGEDMFSTLASNFPMGTVTGAPKIESMRVILENERAPRGPYGGGVGHFGFNGDCTFAVALRTLHVHGENAYIQACGGNVYDSQASTEYEEIKKKLAALRTVLEQFSVS